MDKWKLRFPFKQTSYNKSVLHLASIKFEGKIHVCMHADLIRIINSVTTSIKNCIIIVQKQPSRMTCMKNASIILLTKKVYLTKGLQFIFTHSFCVVSSHKYSIIYVSPSTTLLIKQVKPYIYNSLIQSI